MQAISKSMILQGKTFQVGFQIISRNLSTSERQFKAYLNNVTVLGGGHMGTGIAQISAAAGNFVTVADVSEKALSTSRGRIEQRLVRRAKKQLKNDSQKIKTHMDEVMNKIKFTTSILDSVKDCELVVEAIPEDLELKHKTLAAIDNVASESTVFVTNTSSLPVSEIAECLSAQRKGLFMGVHFFEPVAVRLVETIRIPETKDDVYHKVREWSQHIGQVAVSCRDTPGFIVNRLNIPYLINAVNMMERGDASYQDIDIAMKMGAGYPYGPFELADYVGLDTIYLIMKGWEKRFPDPANRCPKTIIEMYEAKKFGKKVGQGFYKYEL